jgi:hypothetical protein
MIYVLNLFKNDAQIGQRPIEGETIFLIFLKNEPQIGRRGVYVSNEVVLKSEPQIGRRPITGDIIFSILLKNEHQICRRPIKGGLCFKLSFVKK